MLKNWWCRIYWRVELLGCNLSLLSISKLFFKIIASKFLLALYGGTCCLHPYRHFGIRSGLSLFIPNRCQSVVLIRISPVIGEMMHFLCIYCLYGFSLLRKSCLFFFCTFLYWSFHINFWKKNHIFQTCILAGFSPFFTFKFLIFYWDINYMQ